MLKSTGGAVGCGRGEVKGGGGQRAGPEETGRLRRGQRLKSVVFFVILFDLCFVGTGDNQIFSLPPDRNKPTLEPSEMLL